MDALVIKRPESMNCAARRLRVLGAVQGVGFRPYIYRLAQQYGLVGWVLNDGEGVFIHVEGCLQQLHAFTQAIEPNQPVLARVREVRVVQEHMLAQPAYASFGIVSSVGVGRKETVVPADSHVCEDCLVEMFSSVDRRYRYPFINCTNCGPRFSLIRALPYDRTQTTMTGFAMCAHCLREYEDPGDRRFHAQPNACPACGPQLTLTGPTGDVEQGDAAVATVIEALAAGKIVAIKSIGGFHLAANARDGAAVDLLRRRKRRDAKPFAIMTATLESARRYVQCDAHEGEFAVLARPAHRAASQAAARVTDSDCTWQSEFGRDAGISTASLSFAAGPSTPGLGDDQRQCVRASDRLPQ